MYKCLSPGAVGISLPWEQCLKLAKDNGFDGVDVSVDPPKGAPYYKDNLSRYDLKPGGMALPVDWRSDKAKFDEGVKKLPSIAAVARDIAMDRFIMWIWPYSDEMNYKDNFRYHVERLGPCAKILADHGCRLGLEFIGPKSMRVGRRYSFVRTMEQMLELCERVGPNCGLLVDSWHWHTSLGTVEELRTLTNSQVVYVHVNDAPPGIDVDQQQDTTRRLPGETGVIDIGGFMDALRRIGYDGPVVPEPFDKRLKAMTPEQAAETVGASMKKIWSAPVR
jgi:sugar phosphate isomerase/epimerase